MLKKIANKFRSQVIRFVSPPQPTALERIASIPGVSIDPENGLSEDAVFHISPQARQFSIGKGSGCRNFCSFLVWEGASLIIHPGVYFNSYCSVNCLGTI